MTPAGYAPAPTTATIATRLADAVAADDAALLLTPDNDGAGWVRRLEVDGQAFAVRIRDGLIGCDFDRANAATAARWLVSQADTAGVTSLLVASGQPGRFHVWLNVGGCDSVTSATIVGAAKAAGADVRQVIRPPLAPHRLGGRAELLQPSDPDGALGVLEGAGDPAASARLAALIGHLGDQRGGRVSSDLDTLLADGRPPLEGESTGKVSQVSLQIPPRLSVRARELLAAGDMQGYRSRSELLRACLVALANGGTPAHVAMALVQDARTVTGEPSCVAVKAAAKGPGWLAAEWDRACAWVVTHPARSASARNVAAAAIDAARGIRWDRGYGVRGSSLTRCLTVFLEVAFAAGRFDGLTVSRRQLVEASGLGAATAAKALTVLLGEGLIVREDGTTAAWRARAYRLVLDHPLLEHRQTEPVVHTPPTSGGDVTATGSVSPCFVGSDVVRSDHPAWRVQALGPSALRVVQVLGDVPRSAVWVADSVGLSADWVRTLLRRLSDVGLVVRVPGGCVLVSDVELVTLLLDHVASVSGADRLAAGVVALHERERLLYSERLSARGLAANPKFGLVPVASSRVRRVPRPAQPVNHGKQARPLGAVNLGLQARPLEPGNLSSQERPPVDWVGVQAAHGGERSRVRGAA